MKLNKNKRKLLEWEEVRWRMKSRANWLAKGDENIKFLQNYAKQRESINTIWEMKSFEGNLINSRHDIQKVVAKCF